MIQVKIIRDSVVTNSASFPTMEEAQAWLSSHEGMGTFGQKKETVERQVLIFPAVIDSEGLEISPAQYEIQQVEVSGYTVEIVDISAQLEQEQTSADSVVFLASTDFQVLRHIRQKALGQELSLSEEEYLALEQQRADAAARIIR